MMPHNMSQPGKSSQGEDGKNIIWGNRLVILKAISFLQNLFVTLNCIKFNNIAWNHINNINLLKLLCFYKFNFCLINFQI